MAGEQVATSLTSQNEFWETTSIQERTSPELLVLSFSLHGESTLCSPTRADAG